MSTAAMPAIKPVVLPKCSTCVYAQEFKPDGSAECFGHPPTPMIIGAGQDPLGRPSIQLETFVPRVKRDRPACALYQRKLDFATVGNS